MGNSGGNGGGNLDGRRVGKGKSVAVSRPSLADEPPAVDVNEHLTRDLARVRAKFGMDPPPGLPSLTSAWMSDAPFEEDEAEFVDTLADCLGAGLTLQDALTCWETGDLAADDTDAVSPDDESSAPIAAVVPRRPTRGHRLFVR